MVNDFLGNEVKEDCHVSIIFHGCAKVAVFDVKAMPVGSRHGEGAVDEKFESGHISDFHGQVSQVVNEIPTDGAVHVMGFCLLGVDASN